MNVAQIVRSFGRRRDVAPWQRFDPTVPPYQRVGYKAPQRMTAQDYITKVAKWPLVWILDIHGYDGVTSRSQGQANFTLSAPQQGGPGTRLTCAVPLHEGELFGKDGTYVLVVIPATDAETVDAILALAAGV